jgi:hypothetical protein
MTIFNYMAILLKDVRSINRIFAHSDLKQKTSAAKCAEVCSLRKCPGLDSNQHARTGTTPSKWLGYQFQHLGVVLVTRLGLEPRTPTLKVLCSTC